VKPLPPELTEQAQQISSKYEHENWRNVEIGLPDYSDYKEPSILVYATTPAGERIHCILSRSPDLFTKVRNFLDGKAKAS
jgi:hypothetical protein